MELTPSPTPKLTPQDERCAQLDAKVARIKEMMLQSEVPIIHTFSAMDDGGVVRLGEGGA
jgi:hypothetical protein